MLKTSSTLILLGLFCTSITAPVQAQACAGCMTTFGYSVSSNRSTVTTTTQTQSTTHSNTQSFAVSGVNVNTPGAVTPTASYYITNPGGSFNLGIQTEQPGVSEVNINNSTTTTIIDGYSASLF